MENFNGYWPIYKNLEEETLQLAKYIQFTDEQLSVYSVHIADLLMRTVVEIETLSKELYRLNDGPYVFGNKGKTRNLFFDTDCIKYLDDKWNICNRDIIISCTNFNFADEKYKIFKPLKNANKSGDRSSKWNRAYQAVKHDRHRNLKEGNIGNLIKALGALYTLNIYYRNETFEFEKLGLNGNSFDNRLDSDIFAVSYADASKASIRYDDSDNSINIEEIKKLPSAIYVIKYTDDDWDNMHKELKAYNTEIIGKLVKEPEFINKLNERIGDDTENTAKTVELLIQEMQIDYIKKNPPINLGKMMSKGNKEAILNKRQTVYSKNS